jgi:hypothetical protein
MAADGLLANVNRAAPMPLSPMQFGKLVTDDAEK